MQTGITTHAINHTDAQMQEVVDQYKQWGLPKLDKEFIEGQFTGSDGIIDQKEWQATYREFSTKLQTRTTLYNSRNGAYWKEIAATITAVVSGIAVFAAAIGLISGGLVFSASAVAVVALVALLAIKTGQKANSARKERAQYEANLGKTDKPLLLDFPEKIISRKESSNKSKLQRAHLYAIRLQYQARGWESLLDRLGDDDYPAFLESLRQGNTPFVLGM